MDELQEAIRELCRALSTDRQSYWIRELAKMARRRKSIQPAESILLVKMRNPDRVVAVGAVQALAWHYMNQGEQNKILQMLQQDGRACEGACSGLVLAVLRGQSISWALETLHTLIENGPQIGSVQAYEAAKVLAYHYFKRAEFDPLFRLSLHPKRYVREGVQCAFSWIQRSLEKMHSLPRLESIENRINIGFAKWQQAQRPSRDATTLTFRQHATALATSWLHTIALCKVELSKKRDGELLAGETVPKPKPDGRRIYRVLVRRL